MNPLRRIADRFARRMVDDFAPHDRIISNPYITSKYFPLQADGQSYHVELKSAPRDATSRDLPVPPKELWEGWGPDAETYLSSGRLDVEAMLGVVERAGTRRDELVRILDVGCAAGRMMRFLPFQPGRSEIWGVDIKARHIAWTQQHLSPPFSFALTTTMPHLPFEDNTFDLVYCGSVFTHMSELADAWFLEIRRVLRAGGYAYLTIHDKGTLDILFGRYREREDLNGLRGMLTDLDARTSVLSSDFAYFAIGTEPRTMVFYDRDYLVGKWSRYAEIVSVTPEAMDYQTAVLARKAGR
jgi:SAM-dependent methyltransferase